MLSDRIVSHWTSPSATSYITHCHLIVLDNLHSALCLAAHSNHADICSLNTVLCSYNLLGLSWHPVVLNFNLNALSLFLPSLLRSFLHSPGSYFGNWLSNCHLLAHSKSVCLRLAYWQPPTIPCYPDVLPLLTMLNMCEIWWSDIHVYVGAGYNSCPYSLDSPIMELVGGIDSTISLRSPSLC